MKRILITLLFLFVPTLASAASISIQVNSGQTSINTLEGSVRLPRGITPTSIQTGGSTMLFWIEEPEFDSASRTIHFAGTTPGGFAGKREVFTIEGDFDESLAELIWFSGVQALRNDGEGTVASVSLTASVNGKSAEDVFSPEPIYIEIGKSDDLYSGRTFISFVAQDKDSGVERYEVAEVWFLAPSADDWHKEVSPYEVRDRTLLKKVYIKAIDRYGNKTVGTKWLPNRIYVLWFIAILIVVVCVIYVKRSLMRVH